MPLFRADTDCPVCGSDDVARCQGLEGYQCQNCDYAWLKSTRTDRVFEQAVESEQVCLGPVGDALTGTVIFVAPDRSRLIVKTDTGVRYVLTSHSDGAKIINKKIGPSYHAPDYTQFDTGEVVEMRFETTDVDRSGGLYRSRDDTDQQPGLHSN